MQVYQEDLKSKDGSKKPAPKKIDVPAITKKRSSSKGASWHESKKAKSILGSNQYLSKASNGSKFEHESMNSRAIREKEARDAKTLLLNFLQFGISLNSKNIPIETRRFINMCRILLNKPKILLMWEEAVNFEANLNELIQKFFTELGDCTVLSLPKNNYNLLHYDQIALMDSGMVLESSTPWAVFNDFDSLTHNFIRETDSKAFDEHMKIVDKFKEEKLNRLTRQRSPSLYVQLPSSQNLVFEEELLPNPTAEKKPKRAICDDLNFIVTDMSDEEPVQREKRKAPLRWQPTILDSRNEAMRNLEDYRLSYLYSQELKTMQGLKEKFATKKKH